jgi:hypothetical protein
LLVCNDRMWTMGDGMSPWSAFASYRPATKTSYGPPQRHQQCGTSHGIFDTACYQVRYLTILAIEPSRDRRLLTIASFVKGTLRPRLYISPASQPIPANAPPRDTRPLLIASNVKGPLRPRLYISPASQPTPATAPSRDTRLLLFASNVKGPLRPRLYISPASTSHHNSLISN